MEELIARYGLIAIFVGSGIEGEPIALAGGVFAQRQWLSLHTVVLATMAGAFCVDQFWFHLSRNFQHSRLVQKLVQLTAFRRALGLIERHPVWFVLLFRFAYGLRAVAAVAVGASQVSTRKFMALNLVAITLWGATYTMVGYALGPAFAAAEARFGFALPLISVLLSAVVIFLLVRRQR